MQKRPQMYGQQHQTWWKARVCKTTIFVFLLSTLISIAPSGVSRDAVRLPDAFQRWNQLDGSSLPEALSALKRGIDLYTDEHYAAALDMLPASEEGKTLLLGDYIVLYRAKSEFMLGRNQQALEDFRLLEKQHPNSARLRDAVMGQCQALLELNDPKSVLALLEKQKSISSAETSYYQARALQLDGKKDQAIAQYLQIYSKYPTSQYSALAERYLLTLSPKALKGASNYSVRQQRAENFLRLKEFASARALLIALGRVAAPDTKTSQKRKLLLAEVEYNLNKTAVALAALRKLATTDPVLHAKALYLEGACLRRLDKEQAFLELRDKALKLYPKSTDTEELCYSVATYYDVEYDAAKARNAYKILYDAFPRGRHTDRAQWKLALAAYFSAQYDEAARGFWNYLLAYPKPAYASSALYWMGRCHEKLGNAADAQYLYDRSIELSNDGYYGQRARAAKSALGKSGNIAGNAVAGIDFRKVAAACDGIRFSPIQLSDPDVNGARTLERAKQLAAADLQDLALSELRWGIQRYPQNSHILYYVMSRISAEKENYNSVFSYLQNVFPDYSARPRDTLPEEVWQLLYPVRHWEIVSEQAAEANLDPALILGVIRQESGFKTTAQSKANARGLMQLLPSTALRLARSANISRSRAKNLFDAEVNIALGSRHLSYLIKEYGKTELALAAYNAGETRVDRWLQEFGDADMVEFVEQIPFSETRNYVKQIMSNVFHYGALIPRSTSIDRGETE